MTCPECSGPALIAETRHLMSGDVRRRWKCKACKHRWTIYNGPTPTTGPPPTRLSDAAILDMLTSTESNVLMGKRYGCGHTTVRRVRVGDLHSKVLPHVPRWKNGKPQASAADTAVITGPSCLLCIQYNGNPGNPCGLGHPDPIEEGIEFATECSTYLEAS